MAVRTAMEHPIGALPRTPFPASRDFAPVGSMSLDFQVASLSYKSSDMLSRGEEGHEVAKGCTRVRMIMILHVDVTATGGL